MLLNHVSLICKHYIFCIRVSDLSKNNNENIMLPILLNEFVLAMTPCGNHHSYERIEIIQMSSWCRRPTCRSRHILWNWGKVRRILNVMRRVIKCSSIPAPGWVSLTVQHMHDISGDIPAVKVSLGFDLQVLYSVTNGTGDILGRFKKIKHHTGLNCNAVITLRRRHNERDGASNHQPHECLFNRLFRCRSKETSKIPITGLCAGNSPVIGEFPAQRSSNTETVSIWWRHRDKRYTHLDTNVQKHK